MIQKGPFFILFFFPCLVDNVRVSALSTYCSQFRSDSEIEINRGVSQGRGGIMFVLRERRDVFQARNIVLSLKYDIRKESTDISLVR